MVDDAYLAAVADHTELGRTRGIDAVLQRFNLDAILLPTDGASIFDVLDDQEGLNAFVCYRFHEHTGGYSRVPDHNRSALFCTFICVI